MRNGVECRQEVELITEYLEGALSAAGKLQFEEHLSRCTGCKIYIDQMLQTVQALQAIGRVPAEPVSEERKKALLEAFRDPDSSRKETVPLGITDDAVFVDDHIAYFWETDEEFAAGVRFLDVGLRRNDTCFWVGHEPDKKKVLSLLSQKGLNVQELVKREQLVLMTREESGEAMLAKIVTVIQTALDHGARAFRLLGHVGERDVLLWKENDVLAYEAQVNDVAHGVPCLVACMYDVRALAGRIVLEGGFETHPLVLCNQALRGSPFYVPPDLYLARLRKGRDIPGEDGY